jgi:hypothetical protein
MMLTSCKRRRAVLASAVLLSALAVAQFAVAETVARKQKQEQPYFSPEMLLGHIYYLASDELGGRDPGTPGIERAANYIADHFAAAGVEPAGEEGTYFQAVQVHSRFPVDATGELAMTGVDIDPPILEVDYVPFPWSSAGAFAGEVAFVGYGLVSEERGYDDYAGIEVEGKVVLMLRREPPSWSGGGRYTDLARFDNKVHEAQSRGAVAVLIANQEPKDGKEDQLTPLYPRVGQESYGLPALHVTRELADALLVAAELETLEALQEKLDADEPVHCSALLTGIQVSGEAGGDEDAVESKNVIGLIRGHGPQSDEYVVIGAHYDHVGRRARPTLWGTGGTEDKQIHNGADDNASGTAGVIELARALAKAGDLNRSVVVIAFTAEERGFIGSRHFVKSPTVPQDRMVAMLNLDMIGRMQDRVTAYGVGSGVGFEELVVDRAREVGLKVETRGPISGHSDEDPFFKASIPVIFFFAGLHPDVHQPTDDAHKINEQGAARIVQLVYGVARSLIDREAPPTYSYVAGRASLAEESPRAVMGFWPGASDEAGAEGILVKRTAPNGPADRAGIMGGDRIVRIDGQAVNDASDYAKVTADKKPGDTVEVVLIREGEEVTVQVTFAAG